MTLMGEILRKVASLDSVRGAKKYPSPPPEPEQRATGKRKRKYVDKFAHIKPKVDTVPPPLDPRPLWRHLVESRRNSLDIYKENIKLLTAIRRTYFTGGKVDSRWRVRPRGSKQYYYARVNFIKRVEKENMALYRLVINAKPKVTTVSEHRDYWVRARKEIIARAERKFVLFPQIEVTDIVEDPAFIAAPGVKRPSVKLDLVIEDGCKLGTLRVELLTDACPRTCALFRALLAAKPGYRGTKFFRKVPHLYWTGGDVASDSGLGCCVMQGRRAPPPENFHYSHSMPGLLSMRVTPDDEVCGIFNITFKPLPQLDLHNVVFGRVIRPSATFDAILSLGSALSPRPIVRIA